jgi:hypothetical protein
MADGGWCHADYIERASTSTTYMVSAWESLGGDEGRPSSYYYGLAGRQNRRAAARGQGRMRYHITSRPTGKPCESAIAPKENTGAADGSDTLDRVPGFSAESCWDGFGTRTWKDSRKKPGRPRPGVSVLVLRPGRVAGTLSASWWVCAARGADCVVACVCVCPTCPALGGLVLVSQLAE